jgi:hypothetical protein
MEKLTLSGLSKATLKRLVNLEERDLATLEWLQVDSISLTAEEQQQVQFIQSRLLRYRAHLMNEATLWARVIYPLLGLAEQGNIQAWAGVSLQAQYVHFEIEGIADGVLGKAAIDGIESPYLVVVETKRGVENQNPLFQLYGQILAAAHINWENNGKSPQEMFGCYTIADSWTFVRAAIDGLDSDKPTLQIEASREYSEPSEAPTILKILKGIVARHLHQTHSGE